MDNEGSNANGEGNQGQTPGQPQPGASQPVDIEAVVNAIANNPSLMGRLAQSASDRTKAKLEPQVNDLRSQLEQLRSLMQAGLSETAALEILDLRQQVASRQPVAQAPQTPSQPQPTQTFDADSAFKSLGGDPANDPAYIKMYREGPITPEKLLTFLAARQQAPEPGPAQQMPTPGGGPVVSDLDNEYKAAVAKIRRGDVDAQMRLLLQFRERAKQEGVEFHQ